MPENQVTGPITDQAFAGISRKQVLGRLWEIANLSHEMTRNSITGQVKALALIVSMEGMIPIRAQKQSAPLSLKPFPDPVPHRKKPAIPEYNFDYLTETLLASALDPTAAFSIRKAKPYVRRF
jgi:hypothetical protein